MGAPDARDTLSHRLERLRTRLTAAGGQNTRIVAVTKGHTAATVSAAIAAGCHDIGESYAQELRQKNPALIACGDQRPQVHFIGGLQRNKIRKIAEIVDIWQSIDRYSLGQELAKRSPHARVLVQVALSDEESKRGCATNAVPELVDKLTQLNLRVIGLMGIGPSGTPEEARPAFRQLRKLVDQLGLKECSMGMTNDLEVAVQEGSTMVRVGTDLFGPRPPQEPKQAIFADG